jgi:hypothetical protein
VAVTVGRFVMSAAVSDSRIRRLALANSRSPNRMAFVTFSSEVLGRRTRSGFDPPAVTMGRVSGFAPVREFRIRLL